MRSAVVDVPLPASPKAPPVGAPAEAGPDTAGQRGHLVVGERVIEKIAAHAVRRVTMASGAARRVLGVTVGELTETSEARVSVHVDGDLARVSVTLSVHWPSSIAAVAQDVRRVIRTDVTRITALEVGRIDLEVVSLSVPSHDHPRVQ